MTKQDFDTLSVEQKISHFLEEVVDKKGIIKYVFCFDLKSENWFKKGNQWIGPKKQIVEIQGATNEYKVDLQRYAGTSIKRASKQERA